MADYADMAIRTACKRAYLLGEGQKRQEWGISTVIMNKRGNPCPKCLPFVGKVLIDDVWSGGPKSGKSPVTGVKYPLMSSAIKAGLYHPRCKDSHTTYFEGISTPPDDSKYTREELNNLAEKMARENRQQYAKRQEKKFGRLADLALDTENKRKYEQKRREWKKIAGSGTAGVEKPPASGIMKMDLQAFSENDIKNQESGSLKRAIRKYQKQIDLHMEKIAHPEKNISDWDSLDPRMQEGLKRHWNKEIRNFNQSIHDRIDELKVRGDYDE